MSITMLVLVLVPVRALQTSFASSLKGLLSPSYILLPSGRWQCDLQACSYENASTTTTTTVFNNISINSPQFDLHVQVQFIGTSCKAATLAGQCNVQHTIEIHLDLWSNSSNNTKTTNMRIVFLNNTDCRQLLMDVALVWHLTPMRNQMDNPRLTCVVLRLVSIWWLLVWYRCRCHSILCVWWSWSWKDLLFTHQ